jgi:hypothetical protein
VDDQIEICGGREMHIDKASNLEPNLESGLPISRWQSTMNDGTTMHTSKWDPQVIRTSPGEHGIRLLGHWRWCGLASRVRNCRGNPYFIQYQLPMGTIGSSITMMLIRLPHLSHIERTLGSTVRGAGWARAAHTIDETRNHALQ